MEELTSDIPNVSEEATKDLDENGIVRVGARIQMCIRDRGYGTDGCS